MGPGIASFKQVPAVALKAKDCSTWGNPIKEVIFNAKNVTLPVRTELTLHLSQYNRQSRDRSKITAMWAQDVEIHLVYSDKCTVGPEKGESVGRAFIECWLANCEQQRATKTLTSTVPQPL